MSGLPQRQFLLMSSVFWVLSSDNSGNEIFPPFGFVLLLSICCSHVYLVTFLNYFCKACILCHMWSLKSYFSLYSTSVWKRSPCMWGKRRWWREEAKGARTKTGAGTAAHSLCKPWFRVGALVSASPQPSLLPALSLHPALSVAFKALPNPAPGQHRHFRSPPDSSCLVVTASVWARLWSLPGRCSWTPAYTTRNTCSFPAFPPRAAG